MEHKAFGATDKGMKRTGNEDYFVIDEEAGLYIVADGLGGHAAGEVASQMTAEIAQRVINENRQVLQTYVDDPSFFNRARALTVVELAITTACRQVHHEGVTDQSKRGMASTIVLLLILGDNAIIAHVGDSRVYVWRQGQQHQLTEDHSMLREHVKRGLITKEEAAKIGKTAMMSRAVGITEFVEVDNLHLELMPGDLFLLCSDGLCDYFRGIEFGEIAQKVEDHGKLPETLIQFANKCGGKDNITAVIVSVDPDQKGKGTDVARKIEALRRIPLFKHLTYQELVKVLTTVRVRSYKSGEQVIEEGTEGNELFVTLSGSVEVQKGGQKLAELERGSFFGEMGLIDNAPRSADIIARESCRFMVIKRNDFYQLLKAEPQLAVKLLWAFCHVLNDRLRATSEELSFAKQNLTEGASSSRLNFDELESEIEELDQSDIDAYPTDETEFEDDEPDGAGDEELPAR